MSLDKLRELGDAPTGDSSSSSESSSSGSNSYPKEQQRVPHLVIYEDEDEDGEAHAARQPQREDLQLTFIKEDKNSSYELEYVPEYFLRYWMSPSSFRRAEHIVDDVTGKDLMSIINEDPRCAVRAVVESAKVYQTDQELPETERCPVCREELHIIYDDWQKVNGRRACSDHTLGEIKDSGIMDKNGLPRNRLWE